MSIIENVKKELKKNLPPPVNSFMREISILKEELSRQRGELSKLREENRKILEELKKVEQEKSMLYCSRVMHAGAKQMRAFGQMFLTTLLQTALGSKPRLFHRDAGRLGMQPCMYYIVS